MKGMYWSRSKIPVRVLAGLAIAGVVGLLTLERFPVETGQPNQSKKLAAAELASEAFAAIKDARIAAGYPIDVGVDPARSGMVGAEITAVTSISGHLGSKQASVNPNFAAVVVDALTEAGVQSGDVVAVGYTGSFPAMNVAVCTALEVMEVKPVVIASAASSQYGANFKNFLWLDMEHCLYDRGLISFRSIAASRGGYEDRAVGMSPRSQQLLDTAIDRNGLPHLVANDFHDSVDQRMKMYRKAADGQPIRAYINVGGGTVSVGRSLGKKLFQPGINRRLPIGSEEIDGVMPQFIRTDVPVLHMVQVHQLARRYGLAVPEDTTPTAGDADIIVSRSYNRWLAGTFLLGLVLAIPACGYLRCAETSV